MTERMHATFRKCAEDNKKVFVAYIAAGDPDFTTSLDIVDSLVDAGIDILELGVPFSDPLADGEANQLASDRALKSGMTPLKVLKLAEAIRKKHETLPLVLFTYLNPIAYSAESGFRDFCLKAVDAGIDALLPLDLPPEERDSLFDEKHTYRQIINETGISVVSLIAPTTKKDRIRLLTAEADAFIYYVSKEGVTGEGNAFSADFSDTIKQIRDNTDLPVVVGFGISTPEHVRSAISTGVDGVVVGSAIVRKIEAFSKGEITLCEVGGFVSEMTAAASEY